MRNGEFVNILNITKHRKHSVERGERNNVVLYNSYPSAGQALPFLRRDARGLVRCLHAVEQNDPTAPAARWPLERVQTLSTP